MRSVQNRKTIPQNYEYLSLLIDPFLKLLKADPIKNRKKILELCHVGKFLMLLDGNERIEKFSEQPDFIINKAGSFIGLEHQVIIDPEYKEREGFFENLFVVAESKLELDSDLPNFHANCYLRSDTTIQLSAKNRLINEITAVVKHFVLTGELLSNSLIDDMNSMPHDRKTISPNFGAWWQKEITPDVIQESIARKESKIESYIENSGPRQWLLLVMGGLNDSSYELSGEIQLIVETRFEKIYLLEDFKARLFELK